MGTKFDQLDGEPQIRTRINSATPEEEYRNDPTAEYSILLMHNQMVDRRDFLNTVCGLALKPYIDALFIHSTGSVL